VDVPVVVVVLVVVVVRVPEPETAPVVVEAAPELVELAEVVVVPPLAPYRPLVETSPVETSAATARV
jgi:hypothetical protein